MRLLSVPTALRSLGAAAFLAAATAHAQPTVGTLLVAHGGGPEWDANVDSVARAVHTGGPVAVSLLMGPGAATHRFQDAVAQLTAKGVQRIVVVPVFVSSHSEHIEQIRYLAGQTDTLSDEMQHHLHMAGITRPATAVPMVVTPALDDATELARVLADRANAIATAPSRQALFLIGHGPNGSEDYAAWMQNLRRVADSVRAWGGFRDVKVGLVRDDAPAAVRAEAVLGIRETIALQRAATGEDVVVVPILVSSGGVANTKLPNDLNGLPAVYRSTPLLPHAAMVAWVERRVRDAGASRM